MRAHEPLELLKLLHVALDDVRADDVKVVELLDRGAVVLDERTVVFVERVLASVKVELVPCAEAHDVVGASGRRTTERGDAFRRLVGHREHFVDLRVEHLVHGDEVRARHVPMRAGCSPRSWCLPGFAAREDSPPRTHPITVAPHHRGSAHRWSGADGMVSRRVRCGCRYRALRLLPSAVVSTLTPAMPGNAPSVWSLPLNTASGRMGVGMEVPELMTAQQVARLLGVSTETLRKWRARRMCLPYVRVGRHIRYKAADVAAFVERGTVMPDGKHGRG